MRDREYMEEEAMVHHDPGLITRLCRLRHSLAQDSRGLGRGGESGVLSEKRRLYPPLTDLIQTGVRGHCQDL